MHDVDRQPDTTGRRREACCYGARVRDHLPRFHRLDPKSFDAITHSPISFRVHRGA